MGAPRELFSSGREGYGGPTLRRSRFVKVCWSCSRPSRDAQLSRSLLFRCDVMEWSAPPLGEWPCRHRGGYMTPAIVGIDLGKNWFHLVGLDEGGATILR